MYYGKWGSLDHTIWVRTGGVLFFGLALSSCSIKFYAANLEELASTTRVPTTLSLSGPWSALTSTCSTPIQLTILDQYGDPIEPGLDLSFSLSGMGSMTIHDSGDSNCLGAGVSAGSILGSASSATLYFQSASATTITLVASAVGLSDASIRLSVGDEMSFADPTSASAPFIASAKSVVVSDFDGDGVKDAVAGYDHNELVFFKGTEDSSFEDGVTAITLPNPGIQGQVGSVDHGDFDGDGTEDVVLTDFVNDRLELFLGNGDGTFESTPSFISGSIFQLTNFEVADFDGDSALDAVVALGSTENYHVFLGDGSGGFTSLGNVDITGCDAADVTAGLLDGDVIPDIAIACWDTGNVQVYFGVGDGTFSAGPVLAIGNSTTQQGWRVSTARMEGPLDPADDLVVALWGATAQPFAVAMSNGDGTFAGPSYYGSGGLISPTNLVTGDFDGDSDEDVAVAYKSNNGQLQIWENDGSGGLTLHATHGSGGLPPNNPSSIYASDVDGDGESDLIVDGASGLVHVFRGIPN